MTIKTPRPSEAFNQRPEGDLYGRPAMCPKPEGTRVVFRTVGLDSEVFALLLSERRRMEKATGQPVSNGVALNALLRRLAIFDPDFCLDARALRGHP